MWCSITGVLLLGPSGTWMSKDRQAWSTPVEPIAGASPFELPATYRNPRLPHSPAQFFALFEHQKWPTNAFLASLAVVSNVCGIWFE